ncbi:hypothetical protein [Levilactobacillus bambusae]|uniref:Uncharacterized protein n=1 Tax=Levilactobacillus bambusae TaxID=2024736 RepID=A0A2V1N5S2_9LACO|nr:hypothetical protein [Levilactobacillus bambusae]PWG01096.1 hypothetical protein DCM90_02670 [Levilactobacillus bambusae]
MSLRKTTDGNGEFSNAHLSHDRSFYPALLSLVDFRERFYQTYQPLLQPDVRLDIVIEVLDAVSHSKTSFANDQLKQLEGLSIQEGTAIEIIRYDNAYQVRRWFHIRTGQFNLSHRTNEIRNELFDQYDFLALLQRHLEDRSSRIKNGICFIEELT